MNANLQLSDACLHAEFWQKSFPRLSINTYFSAGKLQPGKPPAALLTEASARIQKEGYTQHQDDSLRKLAVQLGEGVKQLHAMGLPTPFLFLFDEAWAAFYRQHAFLSHILGEYRVLPDFWAWHVDASKGEGGWRPHRDKGHISLLADGNPKSLTMWIPLSDATPFNGCMYLLPADRDPVYGTKDENTWQVDYPNIRALPAKPGDYLCWTQAVLHWGSRGSTFADIPRLSMALEFQRADQPAFNTPLLMPLTDLPFMARLQLICKQVLQYRHMYALEKKVEAFALRVLG